MNTKTCADVPDLVKAFAVAPLAMVIDVAYILKEVSEHAPVLLGTPGPNPAAVPKSAE